MCPVAADGSIDVSECVRSKAFSAWTHVGSYLVMVPSMSDMTIWSDSSHRKILAEHTASPEYEEDTENCIVFGPTLRFICFYHQRWPSSSCLPIDQTKDVGSLHIG